MAPSGPNWRQASQPAGSAKPSNRRGLRLFVLCAVLFSGLGMLAAWVLYPKQMKPPEVLTVAVREYDAPQLPPPAFAVQDSQLLLQRFVGRKSEGYVHQSREQFDKLLRSLKQTTEEDVVLHLCALSRAEGDKVYVLPGDAHPDRPETWVDLGDVLAAMKACPAKHKLLILDIMRPLADARLGILTPDIADQVHAYLTKEADLPFWILCACGPGERSLVSEELGLSVFAYFLDRGMSGAADAAGPSGKKDQRISVKELASYTQTAVDRWAKSNRGLAQTPTLLGNSSDFLLAQFDDPPSKETPPNAEKTYPDWLKEGWDQRDKWRRDGSYRLVPRLGAHLDSALVRIENRWRSGIEEKRLKEDLGTEVAAVKEQIAKARPTRPSRHPSLTTLLRLQGPIEDAKQQAALDEVAQSIKMLLTKVIEPGVKPEMIDKARKEEFDKLYGEIKAKLPKLPHPRVAWILFDLAASTQNLTPGRLLLLEEWSRELSELAERKYVETVALERLRGTWGLAETNGWMWPTDAVHAWLKLVRESEASLATLAQNPGAVPWIEDEFKQAEEKRREADKAFFHQFNLKWPEVPKLCQAAENQFRETTKHVEFLRTSQREWDESMLLLPALVPALAAQRRVDAQEDSAWRAMIESMLILGDRLSRPDASFFSPTQADAAGQVASKREALQARLKDRYARSLRIQEDGTPADYWEVQHLLMIPMWTADERVKLWQAGRTMGLRLLKEQDKAMSLADLLVEQYEAIRQRRVALSVDLLKVAGHPNLSKIGKFLADAEKAPTPAKWRTLGIELHAAWAKELPDRLKVGSLSPFEVDRLTRLVPLYDTERPGFAESGMQLRNPLLPILRAQRQALNGMTARRYELESEFVKTLERSQRTFSTFYSQAAEDVRVMP